MTIKFVLLVNKQGQTRLAKYTDQSLSVEERRALEGEIVRKCLARSEKQVSSTCVAIHEFLVCYQALTADLGTATAYLARSNTFSWSLQCSFTEHRNMKVVYRRYASLFFLVGIDAEEVSVRPHQKLQ